MTKDTTRLSEVSNSYEYQPEIEIPGTPISRLAGNETPFRRMAFPAKVDLVTRPLRSGHVSLRLEGGQGMHGNARIPERALRILLDLRRVEAAHTGAVRAGMFPPHDVRERFRVVGIFLRLLVEFRQDTVASEGHPDVVLRIRVALISAKVRVRILVLSDLSGLRVEHS